MHILFLFLDGIGLGDDNPEHNPFAVAHMPNLTAMSGGKRWLRGIGRVETDRSTFIPTDAQMGIGGKPQSATGQATILTGLNVSDEIGMHYGPKPTPEVSAIIQRASLFTRLTEAGHAAVLLNAFPPRFFKGIDSGKRLRSSVQMAVHAAGIPLMTEQNIYDKSALSVDFTGHGWQAQLGYDDTPLFEPAEAGAHLAMLARQREFTFFDHWVTDYIGHRGAMEDGVRHLEHFDAVMGGLFAAWDDANGLIIFTSDHGNMEDLSNRHHTENAVPTLIVGDAHRSFAEGLQDLTHFTPAILRMFNGGTSRQKKAS